VPRTAMGTFGGKRTGGSSLSAEGAGFQGSDPQAIHPAQAGAGAADAAATLPSQNPERPAAARPQAGAGAADAAASLGRQILKPSGVSSGLCGGEDLSRFSHGLTGRGWTMASMPDIRQDADLRIRIPAHWPDTFH
jgi:hypothetical protein